jgi:cellulose synthase/poly-beta-1,6-N-acetylglucosamine synthase-like glycosyltransferase
MAKPLFWISIAAILYTYIGYPVAVWLLSRLCNRTVHKSEITPEVSIVVACYNEERVIEAKIANLLRLDYPRERVEIIIVSDGSTDLTAETARRYESARLRVVACSHRSGKAAALNAGVEIACGEIILFADARQSFEPDVIKRLVASFADASVGAVSGELLLDGRNVSGVGEGVGLYWKYEKWIRKSESLFNSVIGATGAIYAIRRELWKELPAGTILDDVYTPMQIALGGRRVVFEERALAHDEAAASHDREFSRKVRTLMGNYQLCQLMPRLLMPTNILLLQFYSHKLLRLAAPLFLLLLLTTNIAIAFGAARGAEALLYEAGLAAQLLFYASVATGGYLLKRNRKVRLLNLAYVFSIMNAAALVGLFYFVTGKRNVWSASERVKAEG